MTDGVNLTIPDTEKYISVQVIDKNHETQPMIYGSGRHKLTAKTKYAFIAVRTLDDQVRKILKQRPTALIHLQQKNGTKNLLTK